MKNITYWMAGICWTAPVISCVIEEAVELLPRLQNNMWLIIPYLLCVIGACLWIIICVYSFCKRWANGEKI